MNPTPTWRRLLAAALLAAAFSFPARADDRSDSADQAQRALATGQLDRLYTGAQHNVVQPAGPPGAGPVNVRPPLSVPTLPPTLSPLQADLDACLTTSGLDPAAKKFYLDTVAKVQGSEDGLRVLQRMVADCKSGGQPVAVQAPDFQGSVVTNTGGVDSIIGLSGESIEKDGKERKFQFNHKFLDFKDQNAAVLMSAGNMSHELTHLELHSEFRAQLPQYEDVLDYALIDEQNARVVGLLVSYELALPGGKADGDTKEGADLAENPQRYFDDLKLWDAGYAVALQQSELRDPVPALTARLAVLQKFAASLQKELDAYPLHLAQIDHVLQGHADVLTALKQTDPVKLLREQTTKRQAAHPQLIADAQKSIAKVNELLQRLNGPRGDALRAKLKALSYDPAFAAIVARNGNDIERLQKLVADHPLADPAIGNQPMTEGAFAKFFNALHGEDSIHQPAPWKELNPPLDSLKDYALK